MADTFSAEARNKAIGSEVFKPELAALIDEDFSPDYITVAYGTNDWAHSDTETFVRDCHGFYNNLSRLYPDAKIFALAPIWRGDMGDTSPCGRFSFIGKTIGEVVRELPNVTFIDAHAFVPSTPECFAPDLLHPSDLGFSHYGRHLVEELKKHIKI